MARSNKSGASAVNNRAADDARADGQMEHHTNDASASQLHGIDLSKYRQPELVAALDRLTSFTYAGSLLLKPAMKIMWRSAFYQDADVRLNELLTKLKGSTPITEPPVDDNMDATIKQGQADHPKKSVPKRSLSERIFHFFTVGIPMAVLVGLAYGAVNFVSCIWSDLSTVTSTSTQLFNLAKSDLDYYMKHPEARPTKEEAIDAWTGQIIGPYTKTIVERKLGPLSFVGGPISSAVQSLIRRFAYTSANELEKYATKYKGFNPFKGQPQPQVSQTS